MSFEGMNFSSPSQLLDANSEFRRDVEAKESSESDPKLEEQMLGLIADLRTHDPIGIGNKSDFYANEATKTGVKHLARPEKLRQHENTLRHEGRMQTLACLVLERARIAQTKRIDAEVDTEKKNWLRQRMPADVPSVQGYAKDEKTSEEYLVMETVKGKTLSHLMFLEMAKRLYVRDPGKYAALKDASAWREDIVAETLFAHVDELKGLAPDDGARVIYNTLHGTGLISEGIALQVGAGVRALNQFGIFHRDLHERNVMISDDGTKAWIIDFGSAKYDSTLNGASTVDQESAYEIGEAQLWNDQNIAASLPGLTSSPKNTLKPGAKRIRLDS